MNLNLSSLIPQNQTPSVLRILHVDENQLDGEAFHRAFQASQSSVEITTCVRAEEALKKLQQVPIAFDVVVADEKLPGMSGVALCRMLKG